MVWYTWHTYTKRDFNTLNDIKLITDIVPLISLTEVPVAKCQSIVFTKPYQYILRHVLTVESDT